MYDMATLKEIFREKTGLWIIRYKNAPSNRYLCFEQWKIDFSVNRIFLTYSPNFSRSKVEQHKLQIYWERKKTYDLLQISDLCNIFSHHNTYEMCKPAILMINNFQIYFCFKKHIWRKSCSCFCFFTKYLLNSSFIVVLLSMFNKKSCENTSAWQKE